MNVQDVLPRDAIPSIDDPSFDAEYFGDVSDDVVVVEGEPPRAYPVRILSYHEIVNDTVDGRPVAVTWCPICASAVVYDRTVDDTTLEFGVSGKLADDALVMYDRETGSEWKQSSGVCIAGEFEGRQLSVLPATVTAWERFRRAHSAGVTLQPDTTREPEEYDLSPYGRYADADGFGVSVMRGTGESRDWPREDVDPKTTVLGVRHEGEAVGYPEPVVADAGGVVTDSVGDLEIVVFLTGDGLHAYESPGFEFSLRDSRVTGDGTVWDATTGTSADGRALRRVPSLQLYAFAWQDDHGTEAFYGL